MHPSKSGGIALFAGFLTVLLTLFRNPEAGLQAATNGVTPILLFIVLPVAGMAAGVYTYTGGTYSAFPSFLFGTYLGIFSLGLTLGGILSAGVGILSIAVGGVLLPLALITILGSMRQIAPELGLSHEILGPG